MSQQRILELRKILDRLAYEYYVLVNQASVIRSMTDIIKSC